MYMMRTNLDALIAGALQPTCNNSLIPWQSGYQYRSFTL